MAWVECAKYVMGVDGLKRNYGECLCKSIKLEMVQCKHANHIVQYAGN